MQVSKLFRTVGREFETHFFRVNRPKMLQIASALEGAKSAQRQASVDAALGKELSQTDSVASFVDGVSARNCRTLAAVREDVQRSDHVLEPAPGKRRTPRENLPDVVPWQPPT
jgi:hypothetical protein